MVVQVRAIRKLWLGELSCAWLLGDPPVYGFFGNPSNIWLYLLLGVPFWCMFQKSGSWKYMGVVLPLLSQECGNQDDIIWITVMNDGESGLNKM